MTHYEMNGGTFSTYVNVEHHFGLYMNPTVYGDPTTDEAKDATTKAYIAGYRRALGHDQIAASRWDCLQARERYPDAEVVEVRVVLSDGPHDFTWDEFDVWLEGTS